MIEEFKADLVAAILADVWGGHDCEGILSANAGDVVPAAKDQPGVTVDFTGTFNPRDNGNHIQLDPEFYVVLYTSSLRGGYQTAAEVNNNILWRCTGPRTYRGLHRFLRRFTSWTDSAGTRWKVTLDPDTDRGSVKDDNAKFASFATAFRLRLTTMLDPSQY